MNLKFERANGEVICLGDYSTKVECYKAIQDFLSAHHFKSYYTRCWEEDGMTKVDVGSHCEFFYIVEE